MRGFKIFVSNFLPSILYLSAILLGVVCALLSAVIEYSVFRALFARVTDAGILSGQAMPLLIVISLEGSKLCLSVHNQRLHKLPNAVFGLSRCRTTLIRYSLVFISIVCTFAWTTNLLYFELVSGTKAIPLSVYRSNSSITMIFPRCMRLRQLRKNFCFLLI